MKKAVHLNMWLKCDYGQCTNELREILNERTKGVKMSSKKYLTEEKFEQWKGNDYFHLVKKVIRIEAINWTTIAFVVAILGLIIAFVR